MKSLVVVESPTKAKTIKKFLPKGYEVVATYGHVRDLPRTASEIPESVKKKPWAALGVNVEKGFEPVYIVQSDKKKHITLIKSRLKEADELILATDEDREGESISWHLLEVLKPKSKRVKRMVFHEITESSIRHAIDHCRELDVNLVRAQETRRILDRLVGYTISPLLWRKIRTGLSAGRVQSVSLKIIVDREWRRIRFVKSDYWDLKAELSAKGEAFPAKLVEYKGKRVCEGKDFDETTGELKEPGKVALIGGDEILEVRESALASDWKIQSVETKEVKRNPAPPFITSSLQQEANRKLRLSSRDTMKIAQSLYEKGFITYMRTDSTSLSRQAVQAARTAIATLYGEEFLPPRARSYGKSKNAQEAHEAIRPAGETFLKPDESGLAGRESALYEMIWKRTMASQMKNAELLTLTVKTEAGDCLFRSSGKRIRFPGFLRAYVEGSDDPEAMLDDQEIPLPLLKAGDRPRVEEVEAVNHETTPPARFTEASLVKCLEENGVGRPSTYATIITTILDRGYVLKTGEALVPTFTAFLVNNLMRENFPRLVDLGFTAGMEDSLDLISSGKTDHLEYLTRFYKGDEGLEQTVKEKSEAIAPRDYRELNLPGLSCKVRIGKYGPYLEENSGDEVRHSSIPHEILPADLDQERAEAILRHASGMNNELGLHPETGEPVYLLTGNYGPYVQLGKSEPKDKKGKKPKRVGIPPTMREMEITNEIAVKLLGMPRTLGIHPELGGEVQAHVGRYGPFIVHVLDATKDFRSLKAEDNVLEINLGRALEILKQPKRVRTAGSEPYRRLGGHPETGEPVELFKGPYGPYLKYKKFNVAIPKNSDIDQIKVEDCLGWIEERLKKPKAVRKKRQTKKK